MKIAFSCVVDSNPKFEWQAFLLVNSLVTNLQCNPFDIKVHCLPGVTKSFYSVMKRLGVEILDIEPFGGHPYCNKIQQCFSGVFDRYDRVALCDNDLFFLGWPSFPDSAVLAAKLVPLPNPPLPILERIYHKRGFQYPKIVPVGTAINQDEVTYECNLNGGLYLVQTTYLQQIAHLWKDNARWLIENQNMLSDWYPHVDQVAMALALTEMQIKPYHLCAVDNFQLNLSFERMSLLLSQIDANQIRVLHYHSNIFPDGKIQYTSFNAVDDKIKKANEQISIWLQTNVDNVIFWNMRYEMFPGLGSGVGSRLQTLELKKHLLSCAVYPFLHENAKVIDVGCGDLETTKEFAFRNFSGYDVSRKAIEIAKSRRPDWLFYELSDDWANLLGQRADLVICLDVLIHQKNPDEYFRLLKILSEITQKRLIVSGYEQFPEKEFVSEICSYHEPLSTSLKRLGVFDEIMQIGMYRGLAVIVADKLSGPRQHQHDLSSDSLKQIEKYVHRPDLLRILIDISRFHFGFYTKTLTRSVEYTWVLEKIIESMPKEILDIGAGVSPLPIYLFQRGYSVTTIDNHLLTRTFLDKMDWNEWGFLDYSLFGFSITSLHQDVMKYASRKQFDVIYSVSVIEHMPRKIWEGLLNKVALWLKPGGHFILTLDLIPETENLWNFSEGQMVEAVQQHGNLSLFTKSLMKLGFKIETVQILNIPGARTDVALIHSKYLPSYSSLRKVVGWLYRNFRVGS